jgi:hypothetical protein
MSPPKKGETILVGTSSKGQASIAFQPTPADKILVFRGCAIGDFVLNLPTLCALSASNPNARFTLVGYPQILSLARLFIPVDGICSWTLNLESLVLGAFTDLDFDVALVWSKNPTLPKT